MLTSTSIKFGLRPYCAAHCSACRPNDPGPDTAFVVFSAGLLGTIEPKGPASSKKWLIVYSCVEGSPCVLLTLQSNVGSVTSNAVSHILLNSGNPKQNSACSYAFVDKITHTINNEWYRVEICTSQYREIVSWWSLGLLGRCYMNIFRHVRWIALSTRGAYNTTLQG